MTEVYRRQMEDAQPIGLGRADSKSSKTMHDIETVKGVSDIEGLAANINHAAHSRVWTFE